MMDIAKLKAAAEKATPGPWQQEHRKTYDSIHNEEWYNTQVFTEDGETVATLHWYPKDEGDGALGTYRADNAEFIAAAHPGAVLELIAQTDALVAAHVNLKLLADVYRQAYEEALEAKDAQIAELLEKQRLIDICQGQGLEHRIAAEKRAEAAEKRIAELEARTLRVQLPPRASADKYVDEVFNNNDLAAIYNACRLECEVKIKNACAAAGINLETGGEA